MIFEMTDEQKEYQRKVLERTAAEVNEYVQKELSNGRGFVPAGELYEILDRNWGTNLSKSLSIRQKFCCGWSLL